MGVRQVGRRVLVVDDAADTLEVIRRNLERVGIQVLTAGGVREAIDSLATERVDLVVTDLKMPEASGLTLVRHVRENVHDTDVLMITGYPSMATAVEAMREGAVDYLAKPFTSVELVEAVGRALTRLDERRAIALAGMGLEGDGGPLVVEGVLAAGSGTRSALRAARELAPLKDPVLVRGEPGSGRGEVAWWLHALSGERREEMFLRVRAARLSPAALRRLLPSGGTIVLEDVERAPADVQQELVHSIPPGGSREGASRVVATCSSDLRELAERRGVDPHIAALLESATIEVRPLRERPEEFVPLLRFLAERAGRELARPRPTFTESAVALLQGYPWPGNVAEVWDLLRFVASMAPGRPVEPADLPDRFRSPVSLREPPTRKLWEIEAAYIREVLGSLNGNRSRTAEILGIDRKTLREKLRRYEVTQDREQAP